MTTTENYDGVLLIKDERILTEAEMQALHPIQKQFMESYVANKDTKPVEEWLTEEMKKSLPEHSAEEIEAMSQAIITTLRTHEESKKSLQESINNGRSKESWLAAKLKEATSALSTQERVKYLQDLDNALEQANAEMSQTLTTKVGMINQNPSLDGFIAEQHHVNTFNLNAEASGSPFRARVLKPGDAGYTKNSVDIVIEDIIEKKVASRYQCKYYKDAKSTTAAFAKGDYRGQQKLVPADQVDDIASKATVVIQSPDGITSTPLTKEQAKILQKEAQSGKWNDANWSEYKLQDVALGIGKQAGNAALLGAAIGAGTNIVGKLWNDEEIDGQEVVEDAIKTGADFGIKAAAAGALKVGVEKGVIGVIPKGTPAGIIASIAYVGIENVKVVGKMVSGELTMREGLDQMGQVTASAIGGMAVAAKGTFIGATVGGVFGPAGALVGGFIGGTVGYMAGSAVGETIARGYQKVRDTVVDKAKQVGSAIVDTVSDLVDRIGALLPF